MIPILMNNHKFKLVDPEHQTKKPHHDGVMFKKPVIKMSVERLETTK